MKLQKSDGGIERKVLIGMVVHPTVLGRVALRWNADGGGLFASKWCNLVGGWAVKYYNRYHKAPGRAVENVFTAWADKHQDEATVKTVEGFLADLSEEYGRGDDLNPELLIDQAGEHFQQVLMARLADQVRGYIDMGESGKAAELLDKYHKLDLGGGEGIDVLLDTAAIESCFAERQESLIQFPGALGEFFQDALMRDNFVSFTAPDKTGKTFWLLEMGWQAMLQRRKVAFFEVGDLSKRQVLMRLLSRAARHPYRSPKGWPYVVRYPKKIEKFRDDQWSTVEHVDKEFDRPLDVEKAKAACDKVTRTQVRSRDSYFRLSVHPADTLDVYGMKATLESWGRDGFVPDVVIVDYMDLLAAPPQARGLDERARIDATWKAMNGLSKELHCLIVSATQSDADAYDQTILTRKNFSGDKRKNAHPSVQIGINVSDRERQQGSCRLNIIVAREMEYNPRRVVHVAGCLPLGNPAVCSCWQI